MVYQIYYDDGTHSRQVLFDIEVFIEETRDKKWVVEMHSLHIISNAVDYIRKCDKIYTEDDWNQFKKDCEELEELRGWLWETHNNSPRTIREADDDSCEWGKYIKAKIENFADKYNLEINVD